MPAIAINGKVIAVATGSTPEDAVEIKLEGASYYQYEKVFYRKTTYVVVASPF